MNRVVTSKISRPSAPENPTTISDDQLAEWRDSGVVEWWGRREDMPEVFAQSHIICLPSYREGLPKALLEAAACGRPIITTDVSGCREVVIDGHNGLLVPSRNAVALAAAIKRLLDDPEQRIKMADRGRELVKAAFSDDKVVQQTLAVYRELH